MNHRRISAVIFCIMLGLCLFGGCSMEDAFSQLQENGDLGVVTLLSEDESYEKSNNTQLTIADDPSLYDFEEEVPVLYLAVGSGNESDGTTYTWEQLNAASLAAQGEVPYRCESLLQVGNEVGPVSDEFGYGELIANSTVRLYGQTASTRQQKSYRIDIKDGKGSVDGLKTLILAKYFTDPLRVTNKFCLDLMQKSDSLFSTRVKLVHLYVKDVSEADDTLYEDYGLYTMLEPVNSAYLKAREIDKDSALYKTVNFDFSRNEAVILDTTDPEFNQSAFEAVLEIKGGTDNSALIQMLDAVNDDDTPIEDVIDTYFDRDNLYSFLAFEILVANRDMASSGYYLLCPTGSTKFYLIAWDNAGALRDRYEVLKDVSYNSGWSSGVHIFAKNVLVRRILTSEHCINYLEDAVTDLYENVLNAENVQEEADYLRDLTEDELFSLPDSSFARVTQTQYEQLFAGLTDQITENFYAFYDSLEVPAPFAVNDPEQQNGILTFTWESSLCFDQNVTYSIVVDDSWDFESPLRQEEGITDTTWSMEALPAGEYFVKITAVADNGNTQISYEHYPTETKQNLQGVLCFYIQRDGSAVASRFDEED